MKRIYRVLVNIVAALMICVCAAGLTACEDIKKVEVKFTANGSDYTLNLNLYRHLAPKTVDALIGFINDGYYNDAVFYMMDGYSSQIMVGDYKANGKELVQNKALPEIYGEFDNNGTTGSDLSAVKGSVGMWRSWYAGSSYSTSTAGDTANGAWFIPTGDLSKYDGYFCIFAKFDTENTANSEAITALTDLFSSSESYDEYYIYYTGEYDSAKASENYGLTFHCVKDEDYNADDESIFKADEEKGELVRYNSTKVKLPVNFSAKIDSVKVK